MLKLHKGTRMAGGLALALFALTGCQVTDVPPVSAVTPVARAESFPAPPSPGIQPAGDTPQAAALPDSDAGDVSRCQRQLKALSRINPRLYARRRAAFDDLLARAAVYTAVRDEVGLQTRETMDALYKFKTRKICNDIEQTVGQALVSAGERLP